MAACIPLPVPVVPVLPAPFTISPPALPTLSTPGLCCNFVAAQTIIPPIPLNPAILNPAVLATINQALHTVQDFLDHLPPECPRTATETPPLGRGQL